MRFELPGLTAATHTPFDASGELNLDAIEKQAEFLLSRGVKNVFIAGSTGESHSMTLVERTALAGRWCEVVQGTEMKVVVHVGDNCLKTAQSLAAHAELVGASAIATLAPSHFKPATLDDLVRWTLAIAERAIETPFYFYDIPGLTGVSFSMSAYLEKGLEQIPNLVGLKFTNPDLISFQRVRNSYDGRMDILWGIDECLLAAVSLGATGAVGSSYNFASPLYLKILQAHQAGDGEAARRLQYRSVQLIDLLVRSGGYLPAAKATMDYLGVPVGPARLPYPKLSDATRAKLLEELESFDLLANV